MDTTQIEIKRLRWMVDAANVRLIELMEQGVIERPCLDHDCTDHAWWDKDCSHFACTVLAVRTPVSTECCREIPDNQDCEHNIAQER